MQCTTGGQITTLKRMHPVHLQRYTTTICLCFVVLFRENIRQGKAEEAA